MMELSTALVGFLLVLDVCANTEVMELCRTAMEIDCDVDYAAEGDETLCATDGHTYANLCYFSKAKCQNFNMNIEYFGICGAGVAVTDSLFLLTESPSTTEAVTTSTVSEDTTTVDEEELMRQVFCSNVNDISCDDDEPHWYCGSNNVMYKNECEFVKAQCFMDITLENIHRCMN